MQGAQPRYAIKFDVDMEKAGKSMAMLSVRC